MSYYIAKTINCTFEEALEKTKASLKEVGFSVVTTIDMQTNLKNAIDKEMNPYIIFGACNPHYASAVIDKEPRIGVMLPCNVIVREIGPGEIEVATINAMETMQSVANPELGPVAQEVNEKLGKAVLSL